MSEERQELGVNMMEAAEQAPQVFETSEMVATGQGPEPEPGNTASNREDERLRAQVEQLAAPEVRPAKDEATKKLDDVLSKGLKDLYLSLPPDRQSLFDAAGDKTTLEILRLQGAGKLEPHTVHKLIETWLRTIPVDRFFLMQEAKRKTDAVLNHFDNPSL